MLSYLWLFLGGGEVVFSKREAARQFKAQLHEGLSRQGHLEMLWEFS